MKQGDKVLVTQFNGRVLKGSVVAVLDTTAGKKVKVLSGQMLVTVDPKQVELVSET